MTHAMITIVSDMICSFWLWFSLTWQKQKLFVIYVKMDSRKDRQADFIYFLKFFSQHDLQTVQ